MTDRTGSNFPTPRHHPPAGHRTPAGYSLAPYSPLTPHPSRTTMSQLESESVIPPTRLTPRIPVPTQGRLRHPPYDTPNPSSQPSSCSGSRKRPTRMKSPRRTSSSWCVARPYNAHTRRCKRATRRVRVSMPKMPYARRPKGSTSSASHQE